MHDTFKVPVRPLGFGLPDENAHAPDEHISLENYFGGIKSVASLYSTLAHSSLYRAATAKIPVFCGFQHFYLR